MGKGDNKKSSGSKPKGGAGLGAGDYKDQESAARALHKVIQNLDNTVGSLARNFQSIGAGNKDIAKQIASTVLDARSLNSTYDNTLNITTKINELQAGSNKWYADRFNIATDLLGLSNAEALNLDIALSKGKDKNDISLKGLDIEKRLSQLSDAERKKAESFINSRKRYFSQEKEQNVALNTITNAQIQRAQAAQLKANLAQKDARDAFVKTIKDEIKINELSNEAIELKFKEHQITTLISKLKDDQTNAGKATLATLQSELAEIKETIPIQIQQDEILRHQTHEMEKQKIMQASLSSLGDKFKGALGEAGDELVEIGHALKESMVSPMALIGALIGNAIEEFGKIGKSSRDFLNTTGLTVDQTVELRHQAHDLALELRDQGVEMKDVFNAQAALIGQYGSLNQLTDKATEKVVGLKKAFGVTEDAAAGVIAQMQRSTGASAETAGNIAALGANFAKAAGVAPDAVMKDIANSSEDIATYFKGTEKDLVRTAVQARRLGLDLKKVADVSKALLTFESSIEDQMTASVLLGREINLDKARQLAMEGKIQEAAEETLKQVGSLEDFNKMNAVQKEAIAKAAGMTVGDLQKSLQTQKALSEMTATQRAEYEKGLQALNAGNEMTAEKILQDQKNQLTQEKIADAVAKIGEIFANVVLPILEPIFDLLSFIGSIIGKMAPVIKIIGAGFLIWKGALMASRLYSKLINADFASLAKNNVFTKMAKGMKADWASMGANVKRQGKAITEGLAEGEKGSQGFFSRMKDKFKSLFDKKGAASAVTDKSKALMDKVGEDKYAAYKDARAKGMKPGEAMAAAKTDLKPAAGAVDKTADVAKKGAVADKAAGGSKAGEGIKTFFTNLAEGLKAMGQSGVGKGILNTLLAGPGLLAFTLAAPGLLVLSLIGKKVQAGFEGLANGLKAMGDPKVAFGSLVLDEIALSLGASLLMAGAGIFFAAKGMAELAKSFKDMSPGQILATAGAFISFGIAVDMLAAAGVAAEAGILGLAAITGTIIGLGFAVKLAAPGIAQIVGSFKDLVTNIGGDKLASVGGGLIALAGGIGAVSLAAVGSLIAVPAMAVVGVSVGLLGAAFATAGVGFNFAAVGIQTATAALQSLTSSVSKDSLMEIADGLMSVSKALGAVSVAGILAGPVLGALALAGPAISGVGSIFGSEEPPTKGENNIGETKTKSTKITTESNTDTSTLEEQNEKLLAKLDQLINVIANAKGEIKINNSVMGEWIGLGTARNYKAVRQ